MKFVIYRRVSTQGQKESGLGLEAQTRDIDLFLNNYADEATVIKEFIEAKSGKSDNSYMEVALAKRPVLKEAIDYCRKHNATLLVAKLDRLTRDVETLAHIIKHCDLRVACMPLADKFQLHLYASLAEQERDFISQRTKAALKAAKARGVKLGSPKTDTLGNYSKKRAAEFLKVVEPHFIELINKGTSTTQIAIQLNKKGVLSPRDKEWTQPSVFRYIKANSLRERARDCF
ncbi:recombinase family protein [Vibrio harveyi]|uniref:recombinase family protein n=1 Tax=Vibrio harveyi TaxID=669 RepID=UPI0006801226|nr:recombinase family protein [Vibrio harveyi]PNM43644.1 DNA invertase [Vibrio harveyi]